MEQRQGDPWFTMRRFERGCGHRNEHLPEGEVIRPGEGKPLTNRTQGSLWRRLSRGFGVDGQCERDEVRVPMGTGVRQSAFGYLDGVLAFLSVAAEPASGVSATGCSGKATSTAKDGSALDEVSGPGPDATRSDPFVVDPDGSVAWSGETSSVITDGKWTVDAWPSSISGRIGNESGITTRSGVDKVKDRLKLKLPGLYFVKVSLKGSDGAICVAEGWVKINGSPTFTPVWIAGGIAILLGLGGWAALLKGLFGSGGRAAGQIGATS